MLIHHWDEEQLRVGEAMIDVSHLPLEKRIRATYFPVDWKSKVGNSDASANFKTDWHNMIRKGDIVVRESGEI